ncbi:hypothetical protein [Lactococcus lactis]|uniref:hypothetical protein n=1 Tax=Lactococcus lactis TaxID=1358 RepID=UPI001D1913D2|nr:hypothetical protein [Lactococcus lactis]MCC4121353.1 hypothetical protein [Lactococcus lactis]
MKFEFYGEESPCGNGFTQPVIRKECTIEDAVYFLKEGIVINDELTRGIKIVEFKKVED